MVAIKAHQAQAFLRRPDPALRAVLFYGPDAGMVNERAQQMARRFAERDKPTGEIVRLDDESLADDPDRLAVELMTIPMFGGRKVVRAIAGRRIDGRRLKPFIEGGQLEGYLVVEAGDLLPSSELRKLFEAAPHAAAVTCFPDEVKDLGALVDSVLKGAGIGIEPAARELLIARLGADRALSRNEVEKLALYATGRPTITAADVDAVVGDASELALDDIVEAVASGKVAEALRQCERAVDAGEDPQSIILALQRHFLRLHRVRSAVDAGQSLEGVLQRLRPPLHFKAAPVFASQVRQWRLPALCEAVDLIARTVEQTRQGVALETALVERAVLDLALLGSTSR